MTAADDYPSLAEFASRPSGRQVWLIDRRVEARAALDEIERLRDLLRYMVLVEDGPCRLDHHGYCQDHPGGFRDGGCWVAAAKALLPEQENDR